MRRDLAGAIRAVVPATLGLLAVIVFVPGRTSLALRIYALVLCAIGLALVLSALRRSYPRATPLRPKRLGKGDAARTPPSLARLGHELALGVASAFDLHHRVRPRLRALAFGLLSQRRRISLEGEPDTARTILGEELWGLVRSDRPPPGDRLARGLTPAELRRLVESLERV